MSTEKLKYSIYIQSNPWIIEMFKMYETINFETSISFADPCKQSEGTILWKNIYTRQEIHTI